MKSIAGIFRRLVALAVFTGVSAVVCSGVSKHALVEPACACNMEETIPVRQNIESLQPSQLVSIRILDLI